MSGHITLQLIHRSMQSFQPNSILKKAYMNYSQVYIGLKFGGDMGWPWGSGGGGGGGEAGPP